MAKWIPGSITNIYDASEALVLRSKDINFDGVADITYPDSSKDNSKQVGDSQ
jgi:hypothetical protein